ncbi:MAG TPA: hypothetical protein PLD46_03115 [Hyphomicrobium sp.]|nr:hypothetical protein [Hyphomicrobium sp.]
MTDAATRTAPDGTPMSDADLLREQRLQRNLKIAIAAMGALILLGLAAVLFRIVTGGGAQQSAGAPMSVLAPASGEIALELPPGAKVISVSVSGNRLAVHHESPAGTGIAIVDLDTGRRVADVKPLAAVPRN